MNETYQDNHDCTIAPEWIGDPADYICPDAGKVDLILVSPKAKHIGNSAHSFLDAENYLWEDYSPEEGVGDEAADFEEGDVTGIDRGCELDEPASCPCWSSIPVDRYCDSPVDLPNRCRRRLDSSRGNGLNCHLVNLSYCSGSGYSHLFASWPVRLRD